ncbi:hypothetical protein HYH02_002834 [Chlamydomonas schloesseri]|uniref:Centrosomal protein of 19 kDa n=1 Tax=Chlamydomonas schloesseri TaxID=2026947 RepID=A0A835WSF1_9CHLO|nr:hypothetical protein HYH02_002834 [Chlamydomonas schloesseri]|eukprot:KAG2452597.1 hypothetical protein HYH02_002834 [Chlamydomonas schloesseri]
MGPGSQSNAPEPSSRSKKHLQVDGEPGYKARRYAVKYQPPCIFLEYEDASKKRRVRAVKLNGVQPSVDVDRLTKKVIRSFPRKLEPSSVKYDQVRKLVVKLLEYLAAAAAEAATAAVAAAAVKALEAPVVSSPNARVSDGAETSGRVSDSGTNGSVSAPLPAVSPRIDPRGPGGRLLPHSGPGHGGPGHHHRGSIESTMSRFSTSTGGGSSSDSEEDLASALDELSKEMAGVGHSGCSSEVNSRDSSFSFRDRPALTSSRPTVSVLDSAALGVSGSVSSSNAASGAGPGPKSRFAAEAEKLTIGLEITEDLDLNRVSELELKMAKQAMEEDFRKNQLRPGDPGYVYDKQVEFTPAKEANDWDDSDDEEEPAAGSEEPEVDWAEIQAAVAKPGDGATLTATANTPRGGSSADDSSPLRGPGGAGVGSSAKPGDSTSPYNSNDWP